MLRNIIQSSERVTLTMLLALSLTGCFGGGGGDGAPASLVYSGNTNAAVITLDNAPILVGNVLYGGEAGTNTPVAVKLTEETNPRSAGAVVQSKLLDNISKNIQNSAFKNNALLQGTVVAVDINEPLYCDSGSASLTGTLNDTTFTGTLTFTYKNCLLDGITYNGTGTFRVDAFDINYIEITDATITFSLLSVSGPEFTGSMSGTIRMQSMIASNTEKMTLNYVAKDNLTGKMYKFENMIISMIYDQLFFPNSKTVTITGAPARAYDSIYGYVDVNTLTPLEYSSVTLTNPDIDGVMLFTGAAGTSIRVTVLSGEHVQLDLDLDGMPGYEITRVLPWTDLTPISTVNINDTDNDGMYDSWETSHGLNPNLNDANDDPDGDGIINLLEFMYFTDPQDPQSYVPLADLSISQSTAYDSVPNGATKILHTSTIKNEGPYPATDVIVTYTIPPEFSLWSTPFINNSIGGCSGTTTITCSIPGTINPGDVATIKTYIDAINTGAATFTPVVTSASPDYLLSNNSGSLTITVVPPGADIQAQIDAANNGDTIQVPPGLYLGSINFNGKDVHLESTDGPDNTIIFANTETGYGDNDGLIMGPGGSIKGFTITNASGYGGNAIDMPSGDGTLISGNIFEYNGYFLGTSGVAISGYGAPTIEKNIFRHNSCDTGNDNYVVLYLGGTSSPSITNNIFVNNTCRVLHLNTFANTYIINNTFVGNTIAIVADTGTNESIEIYRNNILVNNGIALEAATPGGYFNTTWENNLVFGNTINYSDIADQTGINGNISSDPLFVNIAADDFHLTASSPAIDAGSNLDAPTSDFDGATRPVDGNGDTIPITDIGAYEYQ